MPMKSLEKIIREHIRKALKDSISEIAVYKTAGTLVGHQDAINPEDDIIYNYSGGRAFSQKMQEDMPVLSRYTLTEYLPMSINKENWTMEFETVFGQNLIVEIIKEIKGGITNWKLIMSVLDRGQQLPVIVYNSGFLENYNNFVDKINSRGVSKKISVESH